MKTMFSNAPVLLVILAASGLFQTAFAKDNRILGTWKLNVAKSTIDYAPLPKSELRTYEAAGSSGVKFSVEGIDGSGKPYAYGTTATIDGKDYPMPGTGTRNGGDSVSYIRADVYTLRAVVKKGGRIVNRAQLAVSKDGKLLTITENGTNESGKATHGLRVYDRQ